MSFIEEMRWRGMLHDMTPGTEEVLSDGMKIGYIGFDPTAESLTIGNYVQIMVLKLFQMHGHKPIVVMGGATGRIGDPSGRDTERQLKTYEELDKNLNFQIEQVKQYLDFDCGENSAVIVNNLDIYKNMNVLDFLRDAGKNLTVNYMLSKDSVKNRLEGGLSFTEFSYQLIQAYDFLYLYKEHDCIIQMGGSDQWGNITSGTEFIRRNVENGKAYAATTKLLTKADGKKFGKSAEGNLWMSAHLSSPYKFYQFWINSDDADICSFNRYFSLKSRNEILELEKSFEEDPRIVKKALAEELTIRIHSEKAYQSAMKVSELIFNKKADHSFLKELSQDDLKAVANEIPSFQIDREVIDAGVNILDLLSEKTNILASKGEARRAIQGNAVSVNKQKISDISAEVNSSNLLQNNFLMIENGKKNKFILEIS